MRRTGRLPAGRGRAPLRCPGDPDRVLPRQAARGRREGPPPGFKRAQAGCQVCLGLIPTRRGGGPAGGAGARSPRWRLSTRGDSHCLPTDLRRRPIVPRPNIHLRLPGPRRRSECEQRGCHPVIPLRETPAVKAGKHRPPVCQHGEWTFAGADAKRRAAKWRCPTAECAPASRWIGASRLHTLIPRGTARWKKLYRPAWRG
jgi:hypothetical protein